MNISYRIDVLKKSLIILFFICQFVNLYGEEKYIEEHIKESIETIEFFKENRELFLKAVENSDLSPEFVFAIVAPEYSQYSHLKNYIETTLLENLYVNFGTEYSDFSIGYFQMKPSFIQKIEEFLNLDFNLKIKNSNVLFESIDEKQMRFERVARLNQLEWQIKYLMIFCQIMDEKFTNISFKNINEKLEFYSAAYNSGFYKSRDSIIKMSEVYSFPFFSSKKYKYKDVALEFYQVISKKL